MHPVYRETHLVDRIGWLRAAVLGANDGIISTASLVVGVAAAAKSADDVLVAGVAGLVAGAMSMAAGEYVSVSSQSDTEQADMGRERRDLVFPYPSRVRIEPEVAVCQAAIPAKYEDAAQAPIADIGMMSGSGPKSQTDDGKAV